MIHCIYSEKLTGPNNTLSLFSYLSKSLRKDTKIRIFNACVESVLLYECETWLVTNEIRRKIQTFVNRCLRYIQRIWWPNIISNKDLWKVTGQEDINLEIRKGN